jgi:16S rRNA (adenine(1408)-N(1))-methyltransferase
MVEASRRATRKSRLPNSLFVVAAAESLPPELQGFADEVTIHFPWGSLLRGLLRADPAIVRGLVDVMKPGAGVTLLMSVTDRDRVDGIPTLGEPAIAEMCRRLGRFGLRSVEARPATSEDIRAAHSSWSKRLGGSNRAAWVVRLMREGSAPANAETHRTTAGYPARSPVEERKHRSM